MVTPKSQHPTPHTSHIVPLAGGIMTSCEQGSFDITTAMAGHLGPTTVAAHSALLNVVGLTFVSFPFAVGIAGSIR